MRSAVLFISGYCHPISLRMSSHTLSKGSIGASHFGMSSFYLLNRCAEKASVKISNSLFAIKIKNPDSSPASYLGEELPGLRVQKYCFFSIWPNILSKKCKNFSFFYKFDTYVTDLIASGMGVPTVFFVLFPQFHADSLLICKKKCTFAADFVNGH